MKKPITEEKVKKGFKVSKTVERPENNPLWEKGMKDSDIYASIQNLFPVLNQSRQKLNLDRRHDNSSVRALVVTSVPYNIDSSNRARDWSSICAWAIVESSFVERYRPDLLKGPAGAIRVCFDDIFNPFIAGPKILNSDTKFPWCDKLIVNNSTEVLKISDSIDSGEVATRLSEQDDIQKMQSEIQRLVTSWESSSLCHNTLGEKGTIDRRISNALSKLIRVCYFIYLVAHN